ncbi:putative ring-cleavage extradiol dioxygenase [Sphaerotilus natans subsp. natans DSM 6575]|uniref:Putative ring-cleavage extradiol dioxygenase n=1 Tax=Sphaerotilus natans subsp. natans DSM 6575 TaxID=1286631 RepID=A0A059KGW1_9BURK|nr:VOC family protein [Sphaerotilus natans]KDB50717.1 putative ring-cleavage extradiol dioxygenase [Sphaerotilus natans subsp. natans DSM 6575]SIS02626.1 catechol 2,3-dioxygenase [Sphaerotilus natans]
MASPWIRALRSVALDVPDLARAEAFYTEVWRLTVSARTEDALYLRGSGPDHHLLSLHAGPCLAVRHASLRARSVEALEAVAAATLAAGGRVLHAPRASKDPAGGLALRIADPHGRVFHIVHGDRLHPSEAGQPVPADQPVRLAHAVFNSHDVAATQRFMEQALGFGLSDRTRIMAFMNCDRDHHTLAIGDTDNDALNHIAFLMPALDDVMRGGGRMSDAGFPIVWGPGRHGPGDNVFNYFVGPFGEVIEYTAEVEQIDETYRAGAPADWTWPPGRTDQWGIGPARPELKVAQRNVLFVPV